MTNKEASEYIEYLKGFGVTPGLATIKELCRRLDHPQDKLKFVHIAGTNGKGSVLNFIATILKVSGYRTGRFFSPAISEYRERIQINNRMISKNDFCRYLDIIKKAANDMVADGFNHPTSFEIDTALSFRYFADQNCDIVILETGMGGTFDATNIIKNTLVAVITPVAMDHADYLGRTLIEIAGHKAGIIKAGATVVTGKQSDDVHGVIREKCEECGCRPLFVSPLCGLSRIRKGKVDLKNLSFKQCFTYDGCDLEISLAGEHQIMNAVTAFDVVKLLAGQGFPVHEKNIRKGLREAVWPGRFQLIARNPPFIIDGAHNADAALKLAATLKMYFTNKRIIYIMGVLRDKNYQEIITGTYELAEHIITITPPDSRALSGYELALAAAQKHPKVTSADSILEACELAVLLAGKDGIVVAFGSLTFLESVNEWLTKAKLKQQSSF